MVTENLLSSFVKTQIQSHFSE